MMKPWTLGAIAVSVLSAGSPASAAPLIGDAITCTASGFTCSSGNAVIGNGIEFTGGIGMPMPLLSFDFSSDLLTISNTATFDYGTTFNMRYAFQDLGTEFTGAMLVANNGFSNISQENFSISSGVLGFASSTFFSASRNATLTVRLGTAQGGAVPEPASWAMVILGIGLVGSAMRRRRLKPQSALA